MNAHCGKLMVQVLFLLLLTDLALSEANNRTPARVLAKQTGAAQFEEHIEQPVHYDCNEHHHRLRKRSSDEDLDYEVYQGVVGRPGIDFPIFPRIPQTTFSCRSFGNGYFADLETNCQVFHICEEGRKISFLCPNGTIFQQSELTCDWWFKVNCAGSASFYQESAELLSKARRQRVKPTQLYKGFTNNRVAEVIPTGKPYKGSERRIDSNENPSVESIDFEDISDDRSNDRSYDRSTDRSDDRSNGRSNDRSNSRSNDRSSNRSNNRSNDKLKLQKDKLLTHPPTDDHHHHHNEHELQITAETGSFVKDPRKNSYTGTDKTLNKEREFISDKPLDRGRDIQVPRVQSIVRSNQRNDFNDRQKTGKKIDDDKPAGFYITSRVDISVPSTAGKGSYYTTAQPELYTNRNSLEGPTVSDKQFVTPVSIDRTPHDTYSTIRPDFFGNGPIIKSVTTPTSYPGTYSTARRIDSTRTTPFYTPTVPSVVRTKPTESKSFYVNILKSDEVTTLRGAVTTENATPKPVIIGMRRDNSEIHRFPIYSNGDLKIQVPVYSVDAPSKAGLSLTTSTSGPTYLPKANKNLPVTPANIENSVSRNVMGIIQTVGVLKETMKTTFDDKNIDKNSGARVGLDIPPSSGPGTLVSLTNYFANDEEVTSTVSSEEEQEKYTTASVDIAAGLLSNKTTGKYLSLFGLNQNDSLTDHYSTPTTPIPKVVYPPTAVGDFTRTTIRDLAQNPETRKIAQVFSNAIADYIKDPVKFKEGLVDARPTQPTRKVSEDTEAPSTTPSSFNGGTVTVNILQDTTSSYNINKATTQSYLPPATEKYDTTTNPTTDSNDIAKEINKQFDVSTPFYDSVSTESTEATTYRGSAFTTSRPKPYIDTSISSDLLPPSQDEERDHETLHKVQSQSFVKSFNDLAKSPKSISFDKNKNTFDTFAEKVTTSGNPWLQSQKDKDARTEDPRNKNTFNTFAEKVTTSINPWLQSQKDKDARTEVPRTHAAIAQTEGKSDLFTTTERSITTTGNQVDNATPTDSPWTHPIKTADKQRVDTFSGQVTSTGRTQDQTPWTHLGQNKFDTSVGTVTTTGKPKTSSTVIQLPVKTGFDISAEKVTTTGKPLLQINQQPTVKPTENPWAQITHSIYIDPLTINDGLMREQKTTTLSPFAYVTTDRSVEDISQDEEGIDDILNSPELSAELLPRNNGLQRIANKIFGGLNETEAVHLKNVMKKAEHNQNVLRLLLLLIQTCDDQNGKALEKSRKILLNALINMDTKTKSKTPSQVTLTTTNKIPVTTYRRIYSDITTTVRNPTTTEAPSSSEETTKFEIRVPDPEEEEDTVTTSKTVSSSSERESKGYDNPNRTSDERALELLKSLYSLASKFSRR